MLTSAPLVKTAVYEGPLDLLLELIEKRKLLINDISIATVTDEYIQRLSAMGELPVAEMSQFVSLAATLVLIKSRSLLPLLSLTEEETQDIKELEYRLALYQILKEATRPLTGQKIPYLFEGESPQIEPLFLPDSSVTLEGLYGAAQALISEFPKTITLPHVEAKKMLSLEEVVETLSQRVATTMRLSFIEFAKSTSSKGDTSVRHSMIVSFLALLELIKQGIIKATQESSGDITVESDAVTTPLYE